LIGGEVGGTEVRLRRDALAIFRAALAAVDPETLARNALAAAAPFHPPLGGRLILFAVGKAAVAMARGAVSVLGNRVADGVVLAPRGDDAASGLPPSLRVHLGGHPLPDADGMEGARAIGDVARDAGPLDRILLLLSGGGSALLTLPHPDISLDELRHVTLLMLRAGATIQELNTVRKHLEVLKGGRLAALAVPAPLTAMILSDVIGDPLDVIGSGPVSPDRSTFAGAIAALERRGVWSELPERVRSHLLQGHTGHIPETPKAGDAAFASVHVNVIGNAALAARAATQEAARLGYQSQMVAAELEGEAREIGADLARAARELDGTGARACRVWAGETTVTVRGQGRGGRNQEVALAAARVLEGARAALVMSAGTDGLDGPTDAAGALATGATMTRARELGLDADEHLESNDAYPFFAALDDLVMTGPTGTNVADIMIVLAG
jgi:hydroxypyruvate reductase